MAFDDNANAGDRDMFIVKYSSAGVKQWTRQLGTSKDDGGKDIAVDRTSGVYVTGYAHGNLDGNTNDGNADMFITKYSSAGDKQWTRQRGTSGDDYGQAIAVSNYQGVYVTGSTEGDLDGNTNAGSDDMFIAKYVKHPGRPHSQVRLAILMWLIACLMIPRDN